jgi:carboxyl-terminal processing protease
METPSRSLPLRIWIVVTVLVAVSAYAIGARSGTADAVGNIGGSGSSSGVVNGLGGAPPTGMVKDIDFAQFWDLWQLLETKYYKNPIDQQKMLYGAMEGLAASLGDPYTVFFEPQIAKEFSDSLEGKFEGIGAEIGIKEDQLQIIAPLPDMPADKAGLLPGDAILSINGTSTEAMTVERAVSLIRGKKGTSVTLSVGRMKQEKAERFDVTVVRDTIVVKSVSVKYPKEGIALVTITNFNLDTTDEFRKAVDQLLAKNVKGIVLDMRSNPGGFLDRATAVAGEWVGDQVVVTERRQGVTVDEFRGTGRGKLHGIPTIVLVNQGSASASEIVAGALQDYGEAKLVGKTTFGKGSVQDYTELENGTAVKITVAEWLTPNGRFINDVGIPPDVDIDRTEEDYHAERDPQLEKALELLTGTSTSATP